MPRIPDHIALCSVFLYPSEEDAAKGSQAGGSGFLAHVRSKTNPAYVHVYAVTNYHVIQRARCRFIRMTNKQGGVHIVPTDPQKWYSHPSGDDVTAFDLENSQSVNWSSLDWWSIDTKMFISKEIIDMYQIGYGDEVILVGRLVMQDGRQRNTPIIRFGNISLMADPDEPIKCEGHTQEGFLVDCRSLSGFSGSPAFVTTDQSYRGEQAKRIFESKALSPEPKPGVAVVTPVAFYGTSGPWLLGIDWGHIPLFTPVLEKRSEGSYDNPGTHSVLLNTGIACILPAWRILDVLNGSEFVARRNEEDERLAKLLVTNRPDIN